MKIIHTPAVRRFTPAATAVCLLAATLLTATTAEAAGPADLVVTGPLPVFSTSDPITVSVYADPNSANVPVGTSIASPLVGGPVTESAGTSTYSVDVPQTSALLGAATNGVVNLMVVASTPKQMSQVFGSAATVSAVPSALSGSLRSAATDGAVSMSPMLAPVAVPAAAANATANAQSTPSVSCGWTKISSDNNHTTRIGELHVANLSTMVGTYNYGVQADSTITIGINFNNGNYADNGTNTITNSLGAGGTDPHRGGWVKYVDAGINYGQYNGYGCEAGHSKVQADSSNADPFDGTNSPGSNPWGSCHADPNGFAHVNPAADSSHPGTWNADRSRATNYSGIATVWSFAFGGSTGYTNNINIGWENYSTSAATYVCGNASPVQNSAILYNSPS